MVARYRLTVFAGYGDGRRAGSPRIPGLADYAIPRGHFPALTSRAVESVYTALPARLLREASRPRDRCPTGCVPCGSEQSCVYTRRHSQRASRFVGYRLWRSGQTGTTLLPCVRIDEPCGDGIKPWSGTPKPVDTMRDPLGFCPIGGHRSGFRNSDPVEFDQKAARGYRGQAVQSNSPRLLS